MNNKFIFVVQGEGRGHLTQAIALYELLTAKGHTVQAVLIGNSSERSIPVYVSERIHAPIIPFKSPGFKTDHKNKSIHLGKTILSTFANRKHYQKSMQTIRATVDSYQPDVLVNFYEPIIGLCSFIKKLNTCVVSIAHQYIYLHPEYKFPSGSKTIDRVFLKWYTKLTAFGSQRLVALSFYPLQTNSYKNILLSPPLLRKELKEQEVYKGTHFLVYLVNSGYMQDVINWHKLNPDFELHCFTDSKIVKGKWQYNEKLCFHSLDDRKFLNYMASSKGLITTAGFESVCEALFLGKPVMMVPVEHHFEQWCNSHDALNAGAGIRSDSFSITKIVEYHTHHTSKTEAFIAWYGTKEKTIFQAFEEVLHQSMEPSTSEHLIRGTASGTQLQPGI
jgi:uncharacterized protein (TIGR00661 family)